MWPNDVVHLSGTVLLRWLERIVYGRFLSVAFATGAPEAIDTAARAHLVQHLVLLSHSDHSFIFHYRVLKVDPRGARVRQYEQVS